MIAQMILDELNRRAVMRYRFKFRMETPIIKPYGEYVVIT